MVGFGVPGIKVTSKQNHSIIITRTINLLRYQCISSKQRSKYDNKDLLTSLNYHLAANKLDWREVILSLFKVEMSFYKKISKDNNTLVTSPWSRIIRGGPDYRRTSLAPRIPDTKGPQKF